MRFKFDFMKWRYVWYVFSLVILIPGLVAYGMNWKNEGSGLNLGIDFLGGSLLQVQFENPAAIEQVREVVDQQGIGSTRIQQTGDQFLIRTEELTEDQNNQLLASFREKLGAMDVLRNEKVGAVIGSELTRNAVWALVLGWALMLIYITVRFQFTFGVAAVLTLVHDVLVVVGVFALFRIEIDSAFVAAVLTIIGYSINDTIVVFDRIRESLRTMRKEPLPDIINFSINISLVRSINTALTVIMALVALLVLGGETTKVFSLALLIGTICGCYSTICVASPLYYEFERLWGGHKERGIPAKTAIR